MAEAGAWENAWSLGAWSLLSTRKSSRFQAVSLSEQDYEMLSIVALRAWLSSQFPDCLPSGAKMEGIRPIA